MSCSAPADLYQQGDLFMLPLISLVSGQPLKAWPFWNSHGIRVILVETQLPPHIPVATPHTWVKVTCQLLISLIGPVSIRQWSSRLSLKRHSGAWKQSPWHPSDLELLKPPTKINRTWQCIICTTTGPLSLTVLLIGAFVLIHITMLFLQVFKNSKRLKLDSSMFEIQQNS